MTKLIHTLIATVAILFTTSAFAAGSDELKARFKERHAQLQQLKIEGKLGETAKGYVEPVKPEFASQASVQNLADAENADRTELYNSIARETGVTADTVAQRNAQRNFVKARSSEWLKHADGTWHQKT